MNMQICRNGSYSPEVSMDSLVLSAKYSESIHHLSSHFHDCHQLIYVDSGTARFTVSGKSYLAKPGTVVLISRFEAHSIQIESRDYHRYSLQIYPEISGYGTLGGENLLSVLINRPAFFLHAVDMTSEPRVQYLMREMVREFDSTNAMSGKMLDLLLFQLLILLRRSHPELLPEKTEKVQMVQKIQEQFETNYHEKCTLAELAKEHHISPSHLSHLFKQTTGHSVMGYLASCRIAAAKRCLAETDMEIGTIVASCGFSDNSNFSRTFREVTGMTPSQFRNQFQK